MKKALEEQKAKKEEAKSKPKKSIADDIEKLKNRREDHPFLFFVNLIDFYIILPRSN